MPAVILVAAQCAYSARISIWSATPDTVLRAARWIAEHVQPDDGAIATLPYLDVPVLWQHASLRADDARRWSTNIVWQRYLERLPEHEIGRRGFDLAALPLPKEPAARRAALLDPRPFVARFSPYYGEENDPPAVWTGSPGPLIQPLWAWTLLRTQSPGPIVEIWRLDEVGPTAISKSE